MSKRTVFYSNNAAHVDTAEAAEARGAQDPGRRPRRWYDPQNGEEACRKAGHTLTMNFCKECDRFV